MLCFGASTADLREIGFRYAVSAVATSAIVTRIFWRRIFTPAIHRDKTLPFATIATAVPIWSVILFALSAGLAFVQGQYRGYPFDGFGLFLVMALGVSFTLGLPLTYWAAYFTQRFLARCGGITSA
jgi:hypothetical protein